MIFKKIVTMDEEIEFYNCEVREVDFRTKRLLGDKDLIEIIEEGKSYLVNTDYIIMIVR
ncbi:hypothetical protein [Streptococcus sanguinis]|jgi:hypothetical protein|uniref:hypothetical protein n=1 Tax=Streptococcus sanguinis TaxID=1305 RepID=UPI000F914E53|nr:hypothetical protein [Streptococcus sanguinis]RSI51546.1 hypothetical protein D8870_09640 [Streptococcus sanguinis]DAY23782.1 MAG TPA: hypothetical protein [Caudoviricetes sp.]